MDVVDMRLFLSLGRGAPAIDDSFSLPRMYEPSDEKRIDCLTSLLRLRYLALRKCP
jgi:hypothetical protein